MFGDLIGVCVRLQLGLGRKILVFGAQLRAGRLQLFLQGIDALLVRGRRYRSRILLAGQLGAELFLHLGHVRLQMIHLHEQVDDACQKGDHCPGHQGGCQAGPLLRFGIHR